MDQVGGGEAIRLFCCPRFSNTNQHISFLRDYVQAVDNAVMSKGLVQNPSGLKDAEDFFTAHDGLEQFQLLTVTNPGRVVRDQLPFPVPPMPISEGFWGGFTKIFKG